MSLHWAEIGTSLRPSFAGLLLLSAAVLGACTSADDPGEIVDPPADEIVDDNAGEAPVPILAELSGYIAGTEASLSWSLPDEAEEPTGLRFQAQRSTAPDFGTELVSGDWVAAAAYTFNDLIDGTAYYYRVRSQLADGRTSDFSSTAKATQDASPPQAQLGELAAEQTSLQFDLDFAAEDMGSGIAAVEIWVRRNSLVFRHYGTFQATPVAFVAERGGPHSFYSVAVDSAGNRQPTPVDPQRTTQVPDSVILVDNQGFEWDITHAVHRYGLRVENWEHGMGRDVILPIIEPDMVGPGGIGYPESQNIALVIGLVADGEARAYKQGDLNNREVVDDRIGDVHLAVTY